VTNSWAALAQAIKESPRRQDRTPLTAAEKLRTADYGPDQVCPSWREAAWFHGVALAGSRPPDLSHVLAFTNALR
jgi:hypothetical protein